MRVRPGGLTCLEELGFTAIGAFKTFFARELRRIRVRRRINTNEKLLELSQVTKSKEQACSQRPLTTSGGLPAAPATYGPIFGCVSCHGLMFLPSVVEVAKAECLRSQEAKARYLDLEYVARNPALFLQLDRHWLCRKCKDSIDVGSMPPLAAKNMLGATWSHLPSWMRKLSQPELEMVHLTRVSIFCCAISRNY